MTYHFQKMPGMILSKPPELGQWSSHARGFVLACRPAVSVYVLVAIVEEPCVPGLKQNVNMLVGDVVVTYSVRRRKEEARWWWKPVAVRL